MIPLPQYKKIIQILPILCVDVIITNLRSVDQKNIGGN